MMIRNVLSLIISPAWDPLSNGGGSLIIICHFIPIQPLKRFRSMHDGLELLIHNGSTGFGIKFAW